MIRLKELRTNDRNPRIIKSEQFAKLVKSVKEFPEMLKLRPLIVTDSGEVIGGNMRYKALESLGYEEIPDDWVMCASNLTEEQRKRFIISDNITMGDWDFDIVFSDWEIDELKDWGFDVSLFDLPDTMLSDNGEEESKLESPYTKKIETPVYEITGEKPELETLQDRSKTEVLIEEIRAANIPEDVKTFLISAAERHTVFNFRNIAEYYAHAEPEVQNLMERSALVIIDYDRAIEEGYVKLTNSLIEQMREEYVGDDDDAQ